MSIDDASWDDLRTLLAVVRTGSLSRAAAELGLTQPTVGRRLDRLEAAIGAVLVRRTGQGCRATAQGEALIPAVARMAEASDDVRRVATSTHNDLAGLVRLATGDLPARYLARRAPQLLSVQGLQLEIVSAQGFVSLERGDADLAIRTQAPPGDAWAIRSLGTVHYAIFASPSFLDAHPEARIPEQARSCRWIGYPEAMSVRSARWLRPFLGRAPDLRLSSSVVQLEAARAGAGLVVLPGWIGRDEPGLQQVGDPIGSLSFESLLVIHPSALRLKRVRHVVAWLREVVQPPDG